MHGFATTGGRINITTATDLIIANALGSDPSTAFDSFDQKLAADINSTIWNANLYGRKQLEMLTGMKFRNDPLNGEFSVGDNDDAILDKITETLQKSGKNHKDIQTDATRSKDIYASLSIASTLPGRPLAHPFKFNLNGFFPETVLLPDNSLLAMAASSLQYSNDPPAAIVHLNPDGSTIKSYETPKIISSNTYGSFQYSIRSDGLGGALVMWHESLPINQFPGFRYHIRIKKFDAVNGITGGPAWSTQMEHINGMTPDLITRRDGSVLASWTQTMPTNVKAVLTSEYTPEQGWSKTEQLFPEFSDSGVATCHFGGFTNARIATSSNRNSIAVWCQNETVKSTNRLGSAHQTKIWARTRSTNTEWGPPMLIDIAEQEFIAGPSKGSFQVAIDNSGNAMVAWEDIDEKTGQSHVKLKRFEKQNGWLDILNLPPGSASPNLAMNSNGTGIFTWTELPMHRYDPGRVFAFRFNENGVIGSVTQVNQDTDEIKGAGGANILIDDDGDAVLTYLTLMNFAGINPTGIVQIRRNSRNNEWSDSYFLPPYKENQEVTSIARSENGRISIVWRSGDISGTRHADHSINFPLKSN